MMKQFVLASLLLMPNTVKAQLDTIYPRNIYHLDISDPLYSDRAAKGELPDDSLVWDGLSALSVVSGSVEDAIYYVDDKMLLRRRGYHADNGMLWVQLSYARAGDTAVVLTSFYRSGKAKRVEYILKGKSLTGHCFAEDGSKIKHTPFERKPKFKGDLYTFIRYKTRYPKEAWKGGYEGVVFVNFAIQKDGTVSNVSVTPSHHHYHSSLIAEAIRVVKLTSGKWQPALLDDKPVKVFYKMPIAFSK